MRPWVVDLYCGLGGWAEGFLAEGYDVIGFDIERRPYPGQLVLQDVLTLHGSQFRDAVAIVGSSPCQEFSYRTMPWKRAKALPPPYLGIKLFEAQFRIQREASEAAGYRIPMVVENVKGAQKWVGRAAWHFGSYYLWGDVPALMPLSKGQKNSGGSWFGERDGKPLERNDPRDMRRSETGEWTQMGKTGGCNHPGKALDGTKVPGLDWSKHGQPGYKAKGFNVTAAQRYRDDQKGEGGAWFNDYKQRENGEAITRLSASSSRSDSRKAASAAIAKIPFPLANHIARMLPILSAEVA